MDIWSIVMEGVKKVLGALAVVGFIYLFGLVGVLVLLLGVYIHDKVKEKRGE